MTRFSRVGNSIKAVSYTHLRAHETVLDIVCRLLLEKKKKDNTKTVEEGLIEILASKRAKTDRIREV